MSEIFRFNELFEPVKTFDESYYIFNSLDNRVYKISETSYDLLITLRSKNSASLLGLVEIIQERYEVSIHPDELKRDISDHLDKLLELGAVQKS